jgi:DNA polymerase III delta subunit
VPLLDLRDLEKHIASRRLAPVHLLVGEDVRRMEQVVDAIEATIDAADRPFAIDRLYAGDSGGSPVDIAAAARVFPMLGDRRIVIVLRAERLLKPKRVSKAAEGDASDGGAETDGSAIDATALEEYLDRPVPSTTLVFVASDVDRTRRLTKRLLEKAAETPFAGLEADNEYARRDAQRAAATEIRQDIEQAGRSIDAAALKLLVERAGSDISKLRGDVERLLLYTEGQDRISTAEVEEIAVESSVDDKWAVVNAIGARDAALALRQTALRLERGDSVHAIVGQLRWWVAKSLSQTAPDRVRPAIEALLRTDLALKSSGGDERVLVERLVVELSGDVLFRAPRQP